MADTTLRIRIRADAAGVSAEIININDSLRDTGRAASAANAAVQKLGGAFAGYIGVQAVQHLVMLADATNLLRARVLDASGSVEQFAANWKDLSTIARATGVSMESTVSLFQAVSGSAVDLGRGRDDVLKLEKALQQLGAISGASAVAMKFGMLQFSQAMAGGIVRAEEWNSIMENIPAVGRAIADGLGKTAGQMRLAVIDGKLLANDVFGSLLKQTNAIQARFDQLPPSISRSGESLHGAFSNALARADDVLRVTSLIAKAMDGMAERLDAVSAVADNRRPTQRATDDALLRLNESRAASITELDKLIEKQRAEIDGWVNERDIKIGLGIKQQADAASVTIATLETALDGLLKRRAEVAAKAQREISAQVIDENREVDLAWAASQRKRAEEAAKAQKLAAAEAKRAAAEAAREARQLQEEAARAYKEAQDKQWQIDSDRFDTQLKGDELRAQAAEAELTKQFELEWRRIEAQDAADERRLEALRQQTAEYQRMGSYVGQAFATGGLSGGMQALGQVAGSRAETAVSGAASGWLAQQGMGAAARGMLGGIAGGLAGGLVSQAIGSIFSSETDRVVEQLKAVRSAIVNGQSYLTGDRARARAASAETDKIFGYRGAGSAALAAWRPEWMDEKQFTRIVESAKLFYTVTQDTALAIEAAKTAWMTVGLSSNDAASDVEALAGELQTLQDAIAGVEQWAGMASDVEIAQAAIDEFNATLADGLPKLDGTKESAVALWKATESYTMANIAARANLVDLTDEIDTLSEAAANAAADMDTGLTGQIEQMLAVLSGGIASAAKAVQVFVDLSAEAKRIALDPQLSILKGSGRLAEAKSQYEALLRQSRQDGAAGAEAAQQLGGAAQAYLSEARSAYASGDQYTQRYRQVMVDLDQSKTYNTQAAGTGGQSLVGQGSVLGLIAKLYETDSKSATDYLKSLIALSAGKTVAEAAALVKTIADSKITTPVDSAKSMIAEMIKLGTIKDIVGIKAMLTEIVNLKTLDATGVSEVVNELERAGLIDSAAAAGLNGFVNALALTQATSKTATTEIGALALVLARATANAIASATPIVESPQQVEQIAQGLLPKFEEATQNIVSQNTGTAANIVKAVTAPPSWERLKQIADTLARAAGYSKGEITPTPTGRAAFSAGSRTYSIGAEDQQTEILFANRIWWALGNLGNKSLPAYATGSAYIQSDQLAQIHRGEMVIDPKSSDALRKYGITVSSDNPATLRVMQEMRDEIVELRRAVNRQSGTLAAGVRA